MILRWFARKMRIEKPKDGLGVLEKEMDRYINEMVAIGFTEEQIQDQIIRPESLEKLSEAVENGKEIDPKSFGIFFPNELEKRLESKLKTFSPKSQEQLIKENLSVFKSRLPDPKKS